MVVGSVGMKDRDGQGFAGSKALFTIFLLFLSLSEWDGAHKCNIVQSV